MCLCFVFMLATWVCVFQMEQKQVLPPFKPNISGEFGLDNFDAQFTNEPIQLTPDDEYVLFIDIGLDCLSALL